MFQRFERIAVPRKNFLFWGERRLPPFLVTDEILQTPTLSIFAGTLEHNTLFAAKSLFYNVFHVPTARSNIAICKVFWNRIYVVKRCIDGKRDLIYYRNETDRKCLKRKRFFGTRFTLLRP